MSREDENVEVVRALWEAFERGGVEAVVALTDADVEWAPHTAHGLVLHGHEGLRSFFNGLGQRGAEIHARPRSFEAHGDSVIVAGTVREESWQSVRDSTVFWVYRLRDRRIVSASAYTSRAQALAAAAGS